MGWCCGVGVFGLKGVNRSLPALHCQPLLMIIIIIMFHEFTRVPSIHSCSASSLTCSQRLLMFHQFSHMLAAFSHVPSGNMWMLFISSLSSINLPMFHQFELAYGNHKFPKFTPSSSVHLRSLNFLNYLSYPSSPSSLMFYYFPQFTHIPLILTVPSAPSLPSPLLSF